MQSNHTIMSFHPAFSFLTLSSNCEKKKTEILSNECKCVQELMKRLVSCERNCRFFQNCLFFKRWVQHTCTVLSVQFKIITKFNAWLTNKTFSALHFRRFLLFENHVYYWHFTVQFNTSIACNCHWENVWTLCDCDMTWIGSDWIL